MTAEGVDPSQRHLRDLEMSQGPLREQARARDLCGTGSNQKPPWEQAQATENCGKYLDQQPQQEQA